MRSDRGTKVLLALIAAGLWVLALTQVGGPVGEVQAGALSAALEQSSQEFASPPPGRSPTRTGTSTRPLRWRVRHAMLYNLKTAGDADCITLVSVRNFGPAATTVDVEWLDLDFASVQLSSTSVPAGGTRNFATYLSGGSGNSAPFLVDEWPAVASIWRGSAQVHSDDPRISATAWIRCDSYPADTVPVAITNIPADPVGTTMQFFQAGMPVKWTPPMATPELPE